VTRWGHSHTFLGGLVGGLVLDRHSVLLGVGCFVLGILAAATWRYLAGLMRWARRRLDGPTGGGPFRAW
jgi:ABC-type Mn2+/Zn2+ transport system permease subunit